MKQPIAIQIISTNENGHHTYVKTSNLNKIDFECKSDGQCNMLDGTTYTGQWSKGLRHGKGRLTHGQHNELIYDGEWQNDEMSGEGYLVTDIGDTYTGEFKHNTQDGFGTWLCYENGEFIRAFRGHYKNGVTHGHIIEFNSHEMKSRESYYDEGIEIVVTNNNYLRPTPYYQVGNLVSLSNGEVALVLNISAEGTEVIYGHTCETEITSCSVESTHYTESEMHNELKRLTQFELEHFLVALYGSITSDILHAIINAMNINKVEVSFLKKLNRMFKLKTISDSKEVLIGSLLNITQDYLDTMRARYR